MALDADDILDRRRLRRRMSIWRIAAISAIVGLLIAIVAEGTGGKLPAGDHLVRLEVLGLILEDRERDQAISELADEPNAKALIVFIDSPGGTTAGSEGLYIALRKLAEEKPVVAVLGSVAASGGYITAIGADHIVARRNTITGSIGVLFQHTEVSDLMDKVGVNVEMITSGGLKGKPSPFEPMDPEGREAIRDLILDSYRWFVGLVAERRDLTVAQATTLGDGRVFSGRMALEAKLIDAIGGETEALSWLADQHGVSATLPVRTLEWGDAPPLIEQLVENIWHGFAGNALPQQLVDIDGLVSIWQP